MVVVQQKKKKFFWFKRNTRCLFFWRGGFGRLLGDFLFVISSFLLDEVF